MPTIWENSYVDRLHLSQKSEMQKAVIDIRQAIEPLIGPDAVMILAAIATDVMTSIHTRNQRADVSNACDALRLSISLLKEVDSNLDG